MGSNIRFLQGNEACVEGALYAGLEFFAGYPITPSTEIAEQLSLRLPQRGGNLFRWRTKSPPCVRSSALP